MRTHNHKRQQFMGPVSTFLTGVALAVCFGLAGSADFEQQVADAKFNKQMVQEGTWPGNGRLARNDLVEPTLREPVEEERVAQM